MDNVHTFKEKTNTSLVKSLWQSIFIFGFVIQFCEIVASNLGNNNLIPVFYKKHKIFKDVTMRY